MRIAATIARYLLGLLFFVFGLNNFLGFMNAPLPPGPSGEFLGLLVSTHYAYAIGGIMMISGILFLVNRYVGLGLTLLGPILFNILLYHITMDPKDIGAGVVATILWALVAWQHRKVFERLFAARLEE